MNTQLSITQSYQSRIHRKYSLFFALLGLTAMLGIWAIAQGAYELSPWRVIKALLGEAPGPASVVVWRIRMPRIIAAIMAGWGLAVSGAAIQTLLKNPLGSPFTLGISQGAAFGAAFAIVVFGVGGMPQTAADAAEPGGALGLLRLYSVTFFAFLGAMAATGIVLLLARLKKMSPEAIILAGVALSSLFTSGTILIQFFATETELATVVFWTFGDVARSNWQEIGLMSGATLLATGYLLWNRWNLNALASGEEVARSLGVEVERVRLAGMFIAAFVAALVTAFHGVIAFLGLLAPHMAKRLVGADHRLVIPFACLLGGLLLLLADTVGRVVVGSGTLPVGVLTSFMGAPLFLWLLVRGYRR